ncbi:MAG: hypothetical protein M9907_11960 [Burkholderiaceae bacterium]|nr:hypothetical protein [Burkholderiaceae bacterium]
MNNNQPNAATARQRLGELVSQEIADCLQVLFPNHLPDAPMDRSELAARIGEQRVISVLRQVAEEGEKRGSILTRSVLQPRRAR